AGRSRRRRIDLGHLGVDLGIDALNRSRSGVDRRLSGRVRGVELLHLGDNRVCFGAQCGDRGIQAGEISSHVFQSSKNVKQKLEHGRSYHAQVYLLLPSLARASALICAAVDAEMLPARWLRVAPPIARRACFLSPIGKLPFGPAFLPGTFEGPILLIEMSPNIRIRQSHTSASLALRR